MGLSRGSGLSNNSGLYGGFRGLSTGAGMTGNTTNTFYFLNGSLPPATTLTRASTGWYFDSAGVLQSAANDVARFNYNPSTLVLEGLLNEPARTDGIRNNTMVGVSAPSTFPNNWGIVGANGLTGAVVSSSTVNGVQLVRVRITGTPTTAGRVTAIVFEAIGIIAAVNGQTWASSLFFAIVGGATTNISSLGMVARLRDSGGSTLSAGTSLSLLSATSTLDRYQSTQTLANASVASLHPALNLINTNNTTPINITFDIGLPQLEQGSGASSPIKTTSAAVTRAADVLSLALADGTYDIDITRLSGVTNVVGAVVSGGAYTVPTDLSPLQSVVARRVG